MRSSIHERRHSVSAAAPTSEWKTGSIVAGCAALVMAAITFAYNRAGLGVPLPIVSILAFSSIAILHGRFLFLARQQYRTTSGALQAQELEFQAIFEGALDGILILNNDGACLNANPSALRLLGMDAEQVNGQTTQRVIDALFPDRRAFGSNWEQLLNRGHDSGQSEIIRSDGAQLVLEFTARANFLPHRHMIILRDISERSRAEESKIRSLALARSAWREADALRSATLALSQDLRMDSVLDTLLQTLYQLVPYKSAQVFLLETDTKLFLARESFPPETADPSHLRRKAPRTLDASEYPVLEQVLRTEGGFLISDTLTDTRWRAIGEDSEMRSWLGVPLYSANQVMGILSIAHNIPGKLTKEHVRMAGLLAIPAAVAIQNARLYERAEIYGEELERRLSDLHTAERALSLSEESRKASEERFRKIFQSTPIAFSVMTLADGRFIDVNGTFEHRFGYKRRELIGRTSSELGFWEDPDRFVELIEKLRSGARIHGVVAMLRNKSGEVKPSLYWAETIQLDGQRCLLLVSDDLPCDGYPYIN
jgi:PAS domain S-box-containing protein